MSFWRCPSQPKPRRLTSSMTTRSNPAQARSGTQRKFKAPSSVLGSCEEDQRIRGETICLIPNIRR
jgi:hypothetical protein